MGAYLFVVVCTGIWVVFGWALATPRARRIAVALVALAFIMFWSSMTFGGGGSA